MSFLQSFVRELWQSQGKEGEEGGPAERLRAAGCGAATPRWGRSAAGRARLARRPGLVSG